MQIKVIVKDIVLEDIPKIALLHVNAFPDFFLTSLGIPFLRTYYCSVINHNHGIGICAMDGEKIIGFVVGTNMCNGFHKKIILENPRSFIFQGIRILFSKPGSIIRLLFNFEKKTEHTIPPLSSELLSIGIDPKYKGKGMGKLLLIEFEKAAKQRNASATTLTTDFFNNDSTVKFYEKCGYSTLCVFKTYPDRKMHKMIKYL